VRIYQALHVMTQSITVNTATMGLKLVGMQLLN